MGNDGGSIPKRRELVKEAAREKTTSEAKETLQEQQEYCWTTCPLSQRPLREPVVSDWAGNLYNKDAVIEFLLPAEDEAAEAAKVDKAKLLDGRVTSLKDVQEVLLHVQDSEGSNGNVGTYFERRWSCPITSKTLGPGVKAVYLVPCGHAFEEAVITNATEGRCLQCEEVFEKENVIPILPLPEKERDRLVKRIQRLRDDGMTHTLKKASGKKRKKALEPTDVPTKGLSVHKEGGRKSSNRGAGSEASVLASSLASSVTAKVKAELDEKAKRRKMDDNISGLYSKGDRKPARDGDFMTRGFTMSNASR